MIASMMLFLAVILMFVWAWGETQESVWGYETTQGYRDKALDLTDVLLHTGGTPRSWEMLDEVTTADVMSIGLVSENCVLDPYKLDRFDEMDYDDARRILGLGKEGFYIKILGPDRALYRIGENRDAISSVERPAILNGEIVTFRLSLFRQ